MDAMICPQDQAEMTARKRGGVTIMQCGSCEGIFLPRADLGMLIEQENEWHLSSGPMTQPIPRITSDMQAPPEYEPPKHSRSYLDELFG